MSPVLRPRVRQRTPAVAGAGKLAAGSANDMVRDASAQACLDAIDAQEVVPRACCSFADWARTRKGATPVSRHAPVRKDPTEKRVRVLQTWLPTASTTVKTGLPVRSRWDHHSVLPAGEVSSRQSQRSPGSRAAVHGAVSHRSESSTGQPVDSMTGTTPTR